MGDTFVQKAADGLICKLLPHFTQSAQFTNHETSGTISAPKQFQARFNLNFEKNFFDTLLI